MKLEQFSSEELDLNAIKNIVGGDEEEEEEEEAFDSLDGATTSRRTFTTCTGSDHDSRRTDSD